MDIQAFLTRIGIDHFDFPTLENLRRIIRCHLEAVPFENLDCCFSPCEVSLAPEDLFQKVVVRRRGGVCFELNGLMHWALGALGYQRYPVSVRIYRPDKDTAPITHQGNVVIIDGKKYYCDVGFGGPGPQGVLCLDDDGIQCIAGETFRVLRDGPHRSITRCDDGQWSTVLRFADVPSDPEDFGFLLYFFTSHPQSYFVTQRLVNLTRPDGSLALTNNVFTRRKNGEVTRMEIPEEDIPALLENEFGLVL